MENKYVATTFIKRYLPAEVFEVLDTNTLTVQNNSYIDKDLQETISDVVFNCNYKEHSSTPAKSKPQDAKIILLIEHQSTPHRLMPFRVFHYMFNLLYKDIKTKQESLTKLPAVFMLVYYHGKHTPYPYSMNLTDCFDDPHGLMPNVLTADVPLVDINQEEDDELKQQKLMGLMALALKHYRDKESGRYLSLLKDMIKSLDLSDVQTLDLVETALHYVLIVGNTQNVTRFIKQSLQLPQPVRSRIMTIAEQLEARGEARGIVLGEEKAQHKLVITMLKNGAAPQFIAQIAEVDLVLVTQLKQQLDNEKTAD